MFPRACYIRHLYQFIFVHWVNSCGTFKEAQDVHLNASNRCWYTAHLSPHAKLQHKTLLLSGPSVTEKDCLFLKLSESILHVWILHHKWENTYISSMYAIVIIQNKSLSVHIHNSWTCASSQARKKECHFIHEGWKSSHNPTGHFRTGKGFQDKAFIKI